MPDVLIFADTVTTPEMRHEVPVLVPDPFLYAEKDGKKITMSTAFEVERIAEAGIEAHAYEEFGYDELLAEGKRTRFDIIARDLPLNACRAWGIEEAVIPWSPRRTWSTTCARTGSRSLPITSSSPTAGASRTRPSSRESARRRPPRTRRWAPPVTFSRAPRSRTGR